MTFPNLLSHGTEGVERWNQLLLAALWRASSWEDVLPDFFVDDETNECSAYIELRGKLPLAKSTSGMFGADVDHFSIGEFS